MTILTESERRARELSTAGQSLAGLPLTARHSQPYNGERRQTQANIIEYHREFPTRPSTEEHAVAATVVQLFPAPMPVIEGQLALPLEWDVRPGIPAIPETPSHLRLVTSEEAPLEAGVSLEPEAPSLAWVARMARAVSEVGAGDRPPAQLTRWVERNELARLAARGISVARHPAMAARRKQLAEQRAVRQVRAVRICSVGPGVAETSAVLVGSSRAQAIAMRFEHRADRWVVTALSLG